MDGSRGLQALFPARTASSKRLELFFGLYISWGYCFAMLMITVISVKIYRKEDGMKL